MMGTAMQSSRHNKWILSAVAVFPNGCYVYFHPHLFHPSNANKNNPCTGISLVGKKTPTSKIQLCNIELLACDLFSNAKCCSHSVLRILCSSMSVVCASSNANCTFFFLLLLLSKFQCFKKKPIICIPNYLSHPKVFVQQVFLQEEHFFTIMVFCFSKSKIFYNEPFFMIVTFETKTL